MVKLRLMRLGKKKRPFWRVVAVDSRQKRDSAFLDSLGVYDPLRHEVVSLDIERANAWIGKGATCSPTVLRLLKKHTKEKGGAHAQKTA